MNSMNSIETAIVRKIVRKALNRGYTVSVHDGEEWALRRSTDMNTILSEMAATDETTLRFRDTDRAVIGSILFVHGNDEDVVSDHTDCVSIASLID